MTIKKTLTLDENEIGRAIVHWLRCTDVIESVDEIGQVEFDYFVTGVDEGRVAASVTLDVDVEDPAGGGI